MVQHFRLSKGRRRPALWIVFCLFTIFAAWPAGGIAQNPDDGRSPPAKPAAAFSPMKGPLHNEDCTNFFFFQSVAGVDAGEVIDRYVDVMAGAGVKVFLCNTNAQRTNYRSRVWDAFWDGFDPNGPDNQPFLAALTRDRVPGYRKMVAAMQEVDRQGIDYPARILARCRHDGISPWISLRMDDCHDMENPNHPIHGLFWKKNPQYRREKGFGNFAFCLDYAHPEVRDYYKALIVESLDRYDMDGLELDFMREAYVFSGGKEPEGRPTMTAWIREIRKLVSDSAAKRGHPIRLGVRMPSRPEVAFDMGFDAIAWAKEGLIDLLTAAPRWATLEFDMPMERWRELLGNAPVTLAGGLETRYEPYRGETVRMISPEMAVGVAASILLRGADAVYLFNYFQDGWPDRPMPVYQKTIRAMASLETLQKLPRTVGVTYRDVRSPLENYKKPLPATGEELAFHLTLGSASESHQRCELLLSFQPEKDKPFAPPETIFVNGKPCRMHSDTTAKDGKRIAMYDVPLSALEGQKIHAVKIVSKGRPITVGRVEMSLLSK
jgi:hypothetical protein